MNVLNKNTIFFLIIVGIFLLLVPFFAGRYLIYIINIAGIYSIVALGLNLLMGYAGQISLGHAAFFAIGAYSSALLANGGLSFWLAMPISGFLTALTGLALGLPALRLSGFYLAMATWGFSAIVNEVVIEWKSLTRGFSGLNVPRPTLGPLTFETETSFYYLILGITALLFFLAFNIIRTKTGRALMALRDNESAAQTFGINLARYKTIGFTLSAFYTGIAGSLFAHFMGYIGPDNFTIWVSIEFIVMIIVGGMGSLLGSVLGAIFFTFLPELIRFIKDYFPSFLREESDIQAIFYGLIMLLFIMFAPQGLMGFIHRLRVVPKNRKRR